MSKSDGGVFPACRSARQFAARRGSARPGAVCRHIVSQARDTKAGGH